MVDAAPFQLGVLDETSLRRSSRCQNARISSMKSSLVPVQRTALSVRWARNKPRSIVGSPKWAVS